jgi:hypothetical protein
MIFHHLPLRLSLRKFLLLPGSASSDFSKCLWPNPDRFEESFNGVPLLTGKIALRNRNIGEVGVSYMVGVYNKFQDDGYYLFPIRPPRDLAAAEDRLTPGALRSSFFHRL